MFEVLIFFILATIVGLAFTFFGYPFFRFLLPIWAFFAGFSLAFNGINHMMGAGFISASLGLLLGVVLGFVLALLSYFIYSLAIYIFGVTMGYVLGSGLMLALGFNPGLMTFVMGALGAIALVSLFSMAKMPKFAIMFLTASGGAMAVITGLFVLFGKTPTLVASLELTKLLVWGSWFWIIVWAFLAGMGIAFQYAVSQANEDLMSDYDWDEASLRGGKK